MARKPKATQKKKVKQKKVSKKQHLVIRKPFVVALIAAIATALLFTIIIKTNNTLHEKKEIQEDHLKPLMVTNLEYCNGEKLDLFVPNREKSVPVVIYIHGGGWEYGSKVGDLLPVVKPLLYHGYGVASINYRLSRSAKFPAQIQDVNCAVRYLRAKAADYKIDSSKIGLIGLSAGGHLAALAANASDVPQFTEGSFGNQQSSVQAAVSISGLLDLQSADLSRTSNAQMDLLFAGTNQTRESANPSKYLDSKDPPQFIIYASNDEKVPSSQSLNYYQALQVRTVPAKLLEVKGATHTLDPYFRLSTDPKKTEVTKKIREFFDQHLK